MELLVLELRVMGIKLVVIVVVDLLEELLEIWVRFWGLGVVL